MAPLAIDQFFMYTVYIKLVSSTNIIELNIVNILGESNNKQGERNVRM